MANSTEKKFLVELEEKEVDTLFYLIDLAKDSILSLPINTLPKDEKERSQSLENLRLKNNDLSTLDEFAVNLLNKVNQHEMKLSF